MRLKQRRGIGNINVIKTKKGGIGYINEIKTKEGDR